MNQISEGLGMSSSQFDAWIEKHRPRGVMFSALKVARLMRVDIAVLAKRSGIAEYQLRHYPESPIVQAYLGTVIRILLAAYFITDDLDKAVHWYQNTPLFGSAYRTAEDYVGAGEANLVIGYLGTLEVGSLG